MKRSEICKNFYVLCNKKLANVAGSEIKGFSMIFTMSVKINGIIFSKAKFSYPKVK